MLLQTVSHRTSDIGALQTCSFPCYWSVMWLYCGRADLTICLSFQVLVIERRSWKMFSMALTNTMIPYSHDRGRISTSATSGTMEWNPHYKQVRSYLYFRHLMVNYHISRDNTIFWANADLRKRFLNDKSTTQLFFCTVFQTSFLPPASFKCTEKNHHLHILTTSSFQVIPS